ncbi:MAG: aminotransferase class I/II-fold pyridoxal phosphate-dependent enzyme [Anaerolineales bacterium]|nr:aminotransferase class I/II-fold pyridoxal phosphate-dependent enzyme [Anaerolineales bacterium]
MTYLAERVRNFGTTIFFEMTSLANQHGAVNLGQGFPDFPGPEFLKEAAIAAIRADINQYAPGSGRPALREAIAAKMARHYNLAVNPATDIVVTSGATEAIFATIMGLVNPGDEVILFEPYYDSYLPSVQMAGGVPRFYTLRPPDWRIDPAELAALFSPKTKLILVNTPHNPTGKVYSEAELSLIAGLCRQHDVIAVVDEVYEHIIFDGLRHVSLAGLPGMAERTITISSSGKTFSMTGWKVGWAVAPAELSQAVFRVHQFVTYSVAAPLQEGVVAALQSSDDYYAELAAMYQANRDFLAGALAEAGLEPIIPQGTYFIMVDISHLGFPDDVAFCRTLTTDIGVAAIPPSAFYFNPADGAGLARFAFCKSRATLAEAARRLLKLKRKL